MGHHCCHLTGLADPSGKQQAHHPNAQPHRWLHTAQGGRSHEKAPQRRKASGARSHEGPPEDTRKRQPTPRHYHRNGCTAPQKRLHRAGETRPQQNRTNGKAVSVARKYTPRIGSSLQRPTKSIPCYILPRSPSCWARRFPVWSSPGSLAPPRFIKIGRAVRYAMSVAREYILSQQRNSASER